MRTLSLTPMRMSRLHCCQPEVPEPQGCPQPRCVPQEQRQLETMEAIQPLGQVQYVVWHWGSPRSLFPPFRLSLSWPEHCDLSLDFGPLLPVSSCPRPKSHSLSCPGTGACGSWPFGVAARGFPLLVAPQLSWRLAKHPASSPPPSPLFPTSLLPLGPVGAPTSGHPLCPASTLGRAPSRSTHRWVAWAPGLDPVPGEGSLAALPGVMLHLGAGIYPLAQLRPINSHWDGCQGPGE